MSLRSFRIVCIVEAITWIVLIAASIAKHAFGIEWTTLVIGPIHGVAVLVYFFGLVTLRDDLGWGPQRTTIAVVASVIPMGTWWIVERRWLEGLEEPLTPSVA